MDDGGDLEGSVIVPVEKCNVRPWVVLIPCRAGYSWTVDLQVGYSYLRVPTGGEVVGQLGGKQETVDTWCEALVHEEIRCRLVEVHEDGGFGTSMGQWRKMGMGEARLTALLETEQSTNNDQLREFLEQLMHGVVVEAARATGSPGAAALLVSWVLAKRKEMGLPLDLNRPRVCARHSGRRTALWFAAGRSDDEGLGIIKEMVEEYGARIDNPDHDPVTGVSLLGAAAQGGNMECLQWLIMHRAPAMPSHAGLTVLDQALELRPGKTPLTASMCFKVVAAYRSTRTDSNAPFGVCAPRIFHPSTPSKGSTVSLTPDDSHATALLIDAILRGDVDAAHDAIVHGARSEYTSPDVGWSPLHFAASLATASERRALCRLLLQAHARADVRDNDGWTPIVWAVAYNDHELLEMLLGHLPHTHEGKGLKGKADPPLWAFIPVFESVDSGNRRVVYQLPHPVHNRQWEGPNPLSTNHSFFRNPTLPIHPPSWREGECGDLLSPTPPSPMITISRRTTLLDPPTRGIPCNEGHVQGRAGNAGLLALSVCGSQRICSDGYEELEGEAVFEDPIHREVQVEVIVRYHRPTSSIKVFRKQESTLTPPGGRLPTFLDGTLHYKEWRGGRTEPSQTNDMEFEGVLDLEHGTIHGLASLVTLEPGVSRSATEGCRHDTLLHCAARNGHYEVARMLVEAYPAFVGHINWEGGPPFLSAVLSPWIDGGKRREMLQLLEEEVREDVVNILEEDARDVHDGGCLCPFVRSDYIWYQVFSASRSSELRDLLRIARFSLVMNMAPWHAARYACAIGDCDLLKIYDSSNIIQSSSDASRLLEVACTFASTGRDIEAVRVISENLHPPLTENALYTAMEYAPHYDMARYLLRSQTTPVELTALPLTTANRWNGAMFVDVHREVCIPELQFALRHRLVGREFLYRLLMSGGEWRWHEDHAAFGLSALVAIDLQNDFFPDSTMQASWDGTKWCEGETSPYIPSTQFLDIDNDKAEGKPYMGKRAVPDGHRIIPRINILWSLLRSQIFNICVVSQDLRQSDHPSFAKAHAMHPGSSVWDGYRNQELWGEHCIVTRNGRYSVGARFRNDLGLDLTDPRMHIVRKGDTPHLDTNMAFFQRLTTCLESHGIRHVYLCGPTLDDTVGKTALHCLRKGYLTTVITDLAMYTKESDMISMRESIIENGGDFMESTSLMGCDKFGFKGPPVYMWREVLYSPVVAMTRLLKRPPAGLMDLLLNDFNFVLSPKLPEVFMHLASVVGELDERSLPWAKGFTVAGVHISRQYFEYLKYPLHFLLLRACAPTSSEGAVLCQAAGGSGADTKAAKRLLHRVIDFINDRSTLDKGNFRDVAGSAIPAKVLLRWVENVPDAVDMIDRALAFHNADSDTAASQDRGNQSFTDPAIDPNPVDLSPLELAVALVVGECGLPSTTVGRFIQKGRGLIPIPWGETGCTKGGKEYRMDTFYDIWQPNRNPAVAVASSAVVWQQERPVPLLHKVLRYIRDNYSSASECPSQSPALFDETRNMYTTLPLPRAYKQSVVVGMEAGESPSCKHLINLVKILIQWPSVERRIRVRQLLPSSKDDVEWGEPATYVVIVSKDRHMGEMVKGKFVDRFGLFERSWREGSLLGDTGVSLILQAAPSQAETILHPDILNDSGYGSADTLQTLVIHTDASVQIKHRHLFKATQGGHEVLAYDRHLGVLHWACLLGNVRLLQLLVEGVNVEVLRSSCPVGDEDIVTRIPGTDLYCPTTELGYTPLHYAAYSGSPACLSYLMQNAAATASPSDVGRFINHQAMHLITPANRDMELTLSDIEWVGRVVRNGDTECYIPCCKVSTDGDTALHVAAQFCHVQASETLINAGASLVIRNTKETLDPHDITLAVHTKLILQKEEKYRERAACWCLGICTEPTTGSPTHSQVNRKVSKPSKMMPDEETDDVEQCSIASSAQGDECKPDADDKDEHEDEEEHMRLLHGVFNQREEASAKLYGFAWKYFLTSNPLAYMIFLICFTAAVFLLYQPNGWWTTNAVYDALSTSEYDIPSELQFRADMNHISDIEELALWLKGPFYRNFFENASDYPNVLLGAYHLVGAIRLSVLRSSSTCDNNLAGSLARHVQCYEAWGEHNNNKSGHFGFVWDRWTSSIRTHSFRSQLTGNSWPVHEGLTHLISINNASRRDAILGEGGVVDQGGIDHAVRFLRLAMPLYNTHTHRFLLFELMWEIPPEGNLYPTYRASIFRLSNYDDAVDYVRLVLEVVVLCFMVWFTVEELIDLYYTIRRVIKAQERFSIKERQKLQEVDTTLPRSRFLSNISGDEAADSGGNGEEHDARDMDPLKKTIAERKEEKQKLVTMHQRKGRFRFVRRLTECFSTLMEHRGEWNMLDAAVLILLWSCFATHIIIFCEQAEYTESVVLSPQTAHDDRVVNFEELAHMVTWEQLILSYVMLLSWLKFLKYLTYVPVLGPVVLAIVTTVLSQEVKIFLVVYLVVMASLVLSMAVLLSTINADLANWMGSWFTTLRMMLGDWDFDAMRDSHWLLGPFLFAFAVLFGHLILLNVFIGLVSQVYETQLEEARERWNAKISALYVHKSRQLSLPDVDKLNGSLEFITSCNRRDCYQWRKDPEKWRWDVIDKSIINRYHTATIRTEDIPPLTMGSVRPKESEMQPCNRDRDELPFMQSGPSFRRHPAFAEDLLEQSVSMNEPSS